MVSLNKNKILLLLFFVGLMIFIYSLFLEPYTNYMEFQSKYSEMSVGDSNEYYKLRDEMLTSKIFLQDMGISLILISTFLLVLLTLGKGKIKSPSKKSKFIVMSIFLPIITVLGYVFDLFQAMIRGEFPHWADSLAIPLMGVPIQFFILLLWSLFHLSFLHKVNFKIDVLSFINLKNLNYWLLFIIIISFLLTIIAFFNGQYWYGLPGLLWVYYYFSLGIAMNKEIR